MLAMGSKQNLIRDPGALVMAVTATFGTVIGKVNTLALAFVECFKNHLKIFHCSFLMSGKLYCTVAMQYEETKQ